MEENLPQEITIPSPTVTPPPAKRMSLFKKIFYSIFGIVCFFGLIQVTLQNLFPKNRAIDTKIMQSADWKTYTNKNYNYSVDYPDYLELGEIQYSSVFVIKQNKSSREFPTIYISVIPDGFTNGKEVYNFMSEEVINNFYSLKDNEVQQTQTEPDPQYWMFKRLAAFPVSGIEGVIIQNDNVLKGDGLVNRRVLVRKNGFTYIIGSYYKTQQELDDFQKFLLSFKFIN